jgi:hypothetical protein
VSRKYLGFVDVGDLALAIVTKGIEREAGSSFLKKIGNFFSTDSEHAVETALNVSGHNPFVGVSLGGNIAQVGSVRTVCIYSSV